SSYSATLNSSFPAIQGFSLLVTFISLVIYLLLDIVTAAPAPRVKFWGTAADGHSAMGRRGAHTRAAGRPASRRAALRPPLPVPGQPGDDRRRGHRRHGLPRRDPRTALSAVPAVRGRYQQRV